MALTEEQFLQRFPELHHYTKWGALHGMLTNNTLWATHYKYLNDDTEIEHMKAYLARLLPFNREHKRKLKLKEKIELLYRTTFTKFVTPYIVSFTTHVNGSDYDRENGIASQWFKRPNTDSGGYGEGGYAVVFNTRRLQALLDNEFKANCYTQTTFSNVIYNEGADHFQREFQPLINEAAWFILRRGQQDIARGEDFISKFLVATVSFKHSKWIREHEVRIVANPYDRSVLEYISDNDPNDIKELRGRGIKEIFDNNGKPTIHLFEGLGDSLPITRIIVAPHKDQEFLRQQVVKLVGTKIPVHLSAIPLPTK